MSHDGRKGITNVQHLHESNISHEEHHHQTIVQSLSQDDNPQITNSEQRSYDHELTTNLSLQTV